MASAGIRAGTGAFASGVGAAAIRPYLAAAAAAAGEAGYHTSGAGAFAHAYSAGLAPHSPQRPPMSGGCIDLRVHLKIEPPYIMRIKERKGTSGRATSIVLYRVTFCDEAVTHVRTRLTN